ncbi:MAG: D-alanine--D-alanine ligase [Lentisphaeria bacterium]|nr:D-alanine--D-alanine ligase [Lentisphaeria bacterium]
MPDEERMEDPVLPDCIRCVSWNSLTSLGSGTALCQLCEVADVEQALFCVRDFLKRGFRLVPLGSGFNFAGSDEELAQTIFLKLSGKGFSVLKELSPGVIYAGGACTPGQIVDFALKHGLGGCSGLCGIPGTLGGALAMNAGAAGCCFADFTTEIHGIVLDDPAAVKEVVLGGNVLAFRYRRSPVISGNILVTGAVLRFPPADPEQEKVLIAQERQRRASAPKGRSAGSTFCNVPQGPAGKFLDEVGCKGLEQGAFEVSTQHANWIIRKSSSPCGSTRDLKELMRTMKKRVQDRFNIELFPEVRFSNMSDSHEMSKSPLKVLVLKGGSSSEREVSLQSGSAIAEALREKGYTVMEQDITELALSPEMKQCDIVWPVLHGGFGEDGRIQALMEKESIPFVGSGSAECALLMNKVASKKRMDEYGLPNARYVVVDREKRSFPTHLNLPLVVKPVSEGSTFGLSIVETPAEWDKAVDFALQFGPDVLIEEFFSGVEITIGILNGEALPVIEIRYTAKVYDYDAKYLHQNCDTQYLCNAPSLSASFQEKLKRVAEEFFRITHSSDILRVDMMVDPEKETFCILEGNAIPGCTANSLVPKAAKAKGLTFPLMCAMILEGAAARYGL